MLYNNKHKTCRAFKIDKVIPVCEFCFKIKNVIFVHTGILPTSKCK